MWLLAVVIQSIRQHFVPQNRSLCSAMNVIDAIFDVIVLNVRLNPFLMQMPMIQMAYRLCLLKMVRALRSFPHENQISNLHYEQNSWLSLEVNGFSFYVFYVLFCLIFFWFILFSILRKYCVVAFELINSEVIIIHDAFIDLEL